MDNTLAQIINQLIETTREAEVLRAQLEVAQRQLEERSDPDGDQGN